MFICAVLKNADSNTSRKTVDVIEVTQTLHRSTVDHDYMIMVNAKINVTVP